MSESASAMTPFLMFEGKAKEAIEFYLRVFPNSEVLTMDLHGTEDEEPEGTIRLARISLNGLELLVHDTAINHAFTFTPSISFYMKCSSVEEIEAINAALLDGGMEMVPLDAYSMSYIQSKKYAWVQDRFGVSWQLNLE